MKFKIFSRANHRARISVHLCIITAYCFSQRRALSRKQTKCSTGYCLRNNAVKPYANVFVKAFFLLRGSDCATVMQTPPPSPLTLLCAQILPIAFAHRNNTFKCCAGAFSLIGRNDTPLNRCIGNWAEELFTEIRTLKLARGIFEFCACVPQHFLSLKSCQLMYPQEHTRVLSTYAFHSDAHLALNVTPMSRSTFILRPLIVFSSIKILTDYY